MFIENDIKMNRALDGDLVLIKLDRTKFWKELQNQKQIANATVVGYSNEQAIESRIVGDQ